MAWTGSSVGENEDYYLGTESVTVPDSGGASETSVNTSNLDVDPSGAKFLVGVTVTETCAGDGALNVRVQCSPDGTNNWTTADTMSLDVDPTGANSGFGDADLSAWSSPYWRFQVFSDGTDTQDACTVTVTYTVRDIHERLVFNY